MDPDLLESVTYRELNEVTFAVSLARDKTVVASALAPGDGPAADDFDAAVSVLLTPLYAEALDATLATLAQVSVGCF